MSTTKEKKPKRHRPIKNIKRLKKADKFDSVKELEDEITRMEAEEYRLLQIEEQYVSTHLWEYFTPFVSQDRILRKTKEKLIVVAPSPNKIGKTAVVANTVCSWLMGY